MEVHFLVICHQSPILCPVTFRQISTFCNAFRRFWRNSTLFVYTLSWIFHKPERMCLKVSITDSSTLSLRVAQTLRPLGIIRSMRSYSILADCLQLIWEQEDRLEAVQKEIYERATGIASLKNGDFYTKICTFNRLFLVPSCTAHTPTKSKVC